MRTQITQVINSGIRAIKRAISRWPAAFERWRVGDQSPKVTVRFTNCPWGCDIEGYPMRIERRMADYDSPRPSVEWSVTLTAPLSTWGMYP